MVLRVYLLMLLSWGAAAQTVEGSVFNAATGTAAPGVTVELLRDTTPFYETTTDGGGRFRFDDVKPNLYSIRYQSPDYWLTAGPTTYKPFPVTSESPVHIEARLMPWSRISGRVVDNRGNAVPKARIELTGSGMVGGNRTYLRTSWGGGGGGQLGGALGPMSFQGTSDSQGKFDVQLMPGAYGLSVVAPTDLKAPEPEPGAPPLAWIRSYYPGVPLADSASNIVVLPGGEVSDVELKLLAVPAHAVRGVLVNPDGTPAPKVPVVTGPDFPSRRVESQPDGSFEFPSVPEGEWRLSADFQHDGILHRAWQWIEVSRHDLESVKLRLVAPLTVRGSAVIDVENGAPRPRFGPMTLARRGGRTTVPGDLGLGGGSSPFIPDANGNFIVQAFPGAYHLSPVLQPPPPPYYLEAVRVGDADLITQEVELASDVAISVVYRKDGGTVRGTAENCAAGGVVLFPRDLSLRKAFSRSGPCDPTGHYEVGNVRPGEYYALAFAGNGPVLTPDETLLNSAVKVTVRAGESTSADVKTVTRPVF